MTKTQTLRDRLETALTCVLDRMGDKAETLDQAIEAVVDDFCDFGKRKEFAAKLRAFAQGGLQ